MSPRKPAYRIRLVTTRGLRQSHHVRLEYVSNGMVLMASEKYRDRDWAVHVATKLAEALGGDLLGVEPGDAVE